MPAAARSGRRPVRYEVVVALKPAVADAEGESVARSLSLLGIGGVRSVRTSRGYVLEFEGLSSSEARRRAQEAVDRLLANPVIHRVSVRPLPS